MFSTIYKNKNNMKYTVTVIGYAGDSSEIDELPTTLEIIVPDEITDEDELIDYIGDEISNETGFCHYGFSYSKSGIKPRKIWLN
jgi:hypothetical protein